MLDTNFISFVKESIVEAGGNEKRLYSIIFNIHPGTGAYSTKKKLINIKKELTSKEADKINKAAGKSICGVSNSPLSFEDENLYISIIRDKYVKSSLLTKSQYYDIKELSDHLGDDRFMIVTANVDDIISLVRKEKVRGYSQGIYASYDELRYLVKEIPDKASKKVDSKRKINYKPGTEPEPEETPEEEPDIKPDAPQDVDPEEKKIKMQGAQFMYDYDSIYKSMVKAYNVWKRPGNTNVGKTKKEFEDKLEDFLYTIKRFVKDIDVRKNIIVYHVKGGLVGPYAGRDKKPELYKLILDKAKQELTEAMKMKRVKEMSGTGGAGGSVPAPGSATANPGTGEGMATKYAFGGAGANPKKKKKKVLMKEDANDPEVARAHMKYETLKGYVMKLSLKSGIEDLNKVKQVYDAMDNINSEVAKLADKYEKKDKKTFKELDQISSNIIKLDNLLADMISIIEKAQKYPLK